MKQLVKDLLPKYAVEMMTVLILAHQLDGVFAAYPSVWLNLLLLVIVFFVGVLVSSRYKPYVLYFFTPIFFILFLVVGNQMFAALFLSVVSVYRFDRLFMDRTRDLVQDAIAVSLLVVLLAQFVRTGFIAPENYVLFSVMFILQLVLYFTLMVLNQMRFENLRVSGYLKTVGLIVAVMLTLGVVIGFIYKGIILIVKWLLVGVINIVVFLMEPLFLWMESIDFKMPDMTEEENSEEMLSETVQRLVESKDGPGAMAEFPVEIIVIGLIVLVVIAIVIWLVIRSRKDEVFETESSQSSVISRMVEAVQNRMSGARPEDPIRDIYFDFEEWVSREGIGRFEDETIEEWLARTNLESVFTREELEIYSRVRYGTHSYSDVARFRQYMNRVKSDIRKILKERRNSK